jgi:class 3 adenylate cyclase
VKLSIRAKTVLLLAGVALMPMAGAVRLLIDANETPVRITEQHLQSAVVDEVVQGAMRPLEQVQDDAQAVAAVLSRAAEGAIPDDAAVEAARALVGGRASIDAVRFEVPAAKLSTVIRWRDTAEVVPESTPELRARADADGVAISVAGPTRGIVVARVKPPPGKPGTTGETPKPAASGYVTVRADLDAVARTLQDTAAQRFRGGVSLVLATEDRRVVAAAGVAAAGPGESVASLPIWQMLPTRAPEKGFSVTSAFTDDGTPMVGTLQNVPRNGWVVALWRPESVAYQTLAEMRDRGLYVAAVAAVLAALIGLLVARGLTAPILAIVGQARLVARRKWREVSLSSTRSDEIGELTRGLGEMARDLEQGEIEAKLRGDLSRFMSKQLVDAIVKGEHPLSLGGKRAAVSVVFADVVGFTPLAESRDAEQIVGLLNELFSVLTEIVFRHGGTVDKFIGDAIMAVWGAPVPQEDHAARALGAAEDMMRFLETANEGWRDKYDVEIRLGIGVNSGEALVGNIGSDKRMEYTVIGDVVNVAARLEAIAQPNQVLVAEATRDLVGEAFALRKLGARKLTGRKTETGVYELEVE